MREPNPADALVPEIGALMTENKAEYEKNAKEYVAKYAK
jgi:ubiquitin-protein ligase